MKFQRSFWKRDPRCLVVLAPSATTPNIKNQYLGFKFIFYQSIPQIFLTMYHRPGTVLVATFMMRNNTDMVLSMFLVELHYMFCSLIFFWCLFIWERTCTHANTHVRVWAQEGEREGERENPKQALCWEPEVGLDPMTLRSWPEPKSRVWCLPNTQSPLSLISPWSCKCKNKLHSTNQNCKIKMKCSSQLILM